MKERPSAKQKQTVGAKTEDCLGFKDDVSRQTWFYVLVPVPTDVIREFVATLIVLWFLLCLSRFNALSPSTGSAEAKSVHYVLPDFALSTNNTGGL